MAVNAETINKIRSSIIANGDVVDFADRIPEATQENLQDVGKALFSYTPALNAFVNTLFDKIGLTYVRLATYSNQLAFLKRGNLPFGETIEEVFVDIIKANEFANTPATGEESDVFKVNKPKVLSAFHHLNRKNEYPVTISEDELKMAFNSYEKFGRFITGIFNSLINSDQVDEYIIFKQLVGDVLKNAYRMKVAKPTDKATSEAFSIALRQAGLSLTYPTRKYNQAGVMKTTNISDQVVYLHKDVVPVIDVTQLANNFNMNLGEPLSNRIIVLDDFGEDNDVILGGVADRDFSMIYDKLYATDSIWNPKHRYWNYFLHRQQVISSSPFANVICLATEIEDFLINSISILPTEQNVKKGYSTNVNIEIDYVGTGDLTYKLAVSGNKSSDTTITQDGVVYIGKDETATSITITATSNATFGETPKAVVGTGTINVK